MLKSRVLTAITLLLLLLACLFVLPAPVWPYVVACLIWIAAGEWVVLVGGGGLGIWMFRILAILPVLLFAQVSSHSDGKVLAAAVFASAFAFWAFTAPAMLRFRPQLSRGFARYLVGIIVLVPAGLALIVLKEHSPWALLGALSLVWLADIGAYFVGRAFGKHKLAPNISPGKSWEGVFGGFAAVLVFVLACRALLPSDIGLPGLGLSLILVVLYTAMSVEGDLFESSLKRQAGVKDSGTLLPGHGGVLDRIDSLLPTLPIAGLLVLWLEYARQG